MPRFTTVVGQTGFVASETDTDPDIVIVGGATAYNFFVRPVEGEPTRISKLNTALQLLFVVFVLGHAGFGWPDRIAITVIGAGVIVTVVISGLDYVWSWARRAREDSMQG